MNIQERVGKVFTRLVACELDLIDMVLSEKLNETLLKTLKKQIRENIYSFESLVYKELFFTPLSEIDVKKELEKEEQNG